MKLSISLPEDAVETLDEYARSTGLRSRSAAVQAAIKLLRSPELEDDYATAWAEWEQSGDAAAWEQVSDDGLPVSPKA